MVFPRKSKKKVIEIYLDSTIRVVSSGEGPKTWAYAFDLQMFAIPRGWKTISSAAVGDVSMRFLMCFFVRATMWTLPETPEKIGMREMEEAVTRATEIVSAGVTRLRESCALASAGTRKITGDSFGCLDEDA